MWADWVMRDDLLDRLINALAGANIQKIMRFLKDRKAFTPTKGVSSSEIVSNTGLCHSSVSKAINKLLEQEIVQAELKSNGRNRVWYITGLEDFSRFNFSHDDSCLDKKPKMKE